MEIRGLCRGGVLLTEVKNRREPAIYGVLAP